MTVVDIGTLDAIGRAVKSLTLLKSRVSSADLTPDTGIALNGDNNQLDDTNNL